MPVLIQTGISILVSNVMDLDPDVNLLPGATAFYSAYPAAQGKVGIYTRWGGEARAQQAVTGIQHRLAPRSTTWRQAVNLLRDQYREFSPPGAGVTVTSVLVVPDNDDNSDNSQLNSAMSTAANATDTEAGTGAFEGIMELLNALPPHMRESVYNNCHASRPATSSTTVPTTAQRQRTTKSASGTVMGSTTAKGSTTIKGPATASAQEEASNAAVPSPATLTTATIVATTPPPLSTPIKQRIPSAISNTNMAGGSHPPLTPKTPSAVRASTSSTRTLINSPLCGTGFALFSAPKEYYVLGYWTRAVLKFVGCDLEVVPIIKAHLVHFANDEDDIELQASLAKNLQVELSHFVVNLLKLDVFLKSVGHYA